MKKLILTLTFLCLLTSACAPAATASPAASPAVTGANANPQAWIDAPLTGSTLPFAEVEVISHAASPNGVAQVELSVNGTVIRTDPNPEPGQPFSMARQKWQPTSGGTYTLSVRTQTQSGDWSNPASVTITILEPSPTLPATATSTATPSATATETASPTPSGPLTIVVVRNSFCRTGPGQVYRDITALATGDNAEIRGISQDGLWLFVYWPKFKVECWIVTSAAPAETDLSGVPALVAPPTPVPSAVPPTEVSITATPIPPTPYKP